MTDQAVSSSASSQPLDASILSVGLLYDLRRLNQTLAKGHHHFSKCAQLRESSHAFTELQHTVDELMNKVVGVTMQSGFFRAALSEARSSIADDLDSGAAGLEEPPEWYLEIETSLWKGEKFDYKKWLTLEKTDYTQITRKAIRALASNLAQFVRDPEDWLVNLTERARERELTSVVGRGREIAQCASILSRPRKNNVLLVGEPGVGKTAIVEGLAQMIANRQLPTELDRAEIYSMSFASLKAGVSQKGALEARIEELVQRLEEGGKRRILFMDEFHLVMQEKGVADHLKPSLASGHYGCIGATTHDEYQKYLSKDGALTRRFEVVLVEEMSRAATSELLLELHSGIEEQYGFPVSLSALDTAVEMASGYLKNRQHPDKALDVLHGAASQLSLDQLFEPRIFPDWARQQREIELRQRAGANDPLALEARRQELNTDVKQGRKQWEKQLLEVSRFRAQFKVWKSEENKKVELTEAQRVIDEWVAGLAAVIPKITEWYRAQQGEHSNLFKKAYDRLKRHYGKITRLREKLEESKSCFTKVRSDCSDWVDEADDQASRQESALKKLERAWANKNDRMVELVLQPKHIIHHMSLLTGLPLDRRHGLSSEQSEIEKSLKQRVIGQERAVGAVANLIRLYQTGLRSAGRPAGVCLFCGPTGVGKTELGKAVAEYLFGSDERLTRIDMSEMHSPHSIARLIGAPPGYVGYHESGQLTEALRRQPFSVVLLDEMGKANGEIYHLFLQLFDEGRITDGQGRVIDAANAFFIMTTNLTDQNLKGAPAEFFNRIDEIVEFSPIESLMPKIMRLHLKKLGERIERQRGLKLEYDPVKLEPILCDSFSGSKYGARSILRAIDQHILKQVALVLKGGAQTVHISFTLTPWYTMPWSVIWRAFFQQNIARTARAMGFKGERWKVEPKYLGTLSCRADK